MTVTRGAAIYWAGVPGVLTTARFERTAGLEPDTAVVQFTEEAFQGLAPLFDEDRFKATTKTMDPASLALQLRAGIPVPYDKPSLDLPYRADLVLVEDVEDNVGRRTVTVKDMFLAESHWVEDPTPEIAGNRIREVALVDYRRWWRNYGELTRNINVLRGDDETPTLDSTITPARDFEDAKKKKWSLEKIFTWLLDHLPGRPKLVNFPSATLAGIERTLRLWGAKPYDVLAQLLQDYNLVLWLNLDGSVSVYEFGAGKVGELTSSKGGENTIEHVSVFEGPWAGLITEDSTGERTPPDQPTEVIVIGPAKVWTAQLDYCMPVLYRETTDEKTDKRQPEVAEVTRSVLTAIARGRDPFRPNTPVIGELAEDEVDTQVFLQLPLDESVWENKIMAARYRLETGSPRTPEDAEAAARVEQLLAADPDSRSIGQDTKDLLDRQLWRYYKTPRQFERLLPLLDRAERAPNGDRLTIEVEAFSFTAIEHRFTDPELGLPDMRSVKEREMQLLIEEIERLGRLLERIRTFESRDLERLWNSIIRQDFLRTDEQVKRFRQAEERMVTEDLPEAEGIDDYRGTTAGVDDMLRRAVGSLLGLDVPRRDDLIEGVKRARASLQAKYNSLLAEINPLSAARSTLLDLQLKQEENIGKTGVADAATTALIAVTRRQIAQLEAEEVAAEEKKPNVVKVHINRARVPVDFRIVNAELGIFEITGPLPVWLEDARVADAAETRIQPMPVRITFGTFNGLRQQFETQPALQTNPWARAIFVALQEGGEAGEPQDLSRKYLQDTGHRVPPEPILSDQREGVTEKLRSGAFELREAERTQTRFTFKLDDPESGEALVTDLAWVVTDPDLQELISLDGTSNRAVLLKRAKEIAELLMFGSSFQRLPTGSLRIMYPHPVNGNGVISAVAYELTPEGGIDTIVSFNDVLEALPGVEKEGKGQDLIEAFGLDTSTFK